jgi:hypothetical protein
MYFNKETFTVLIRLVFIQNLQLNYLKYDEAQDMNPILTIQ